MPANLVCSLWLRFEKSLLDLIRGLRHHKGNEKAYIQNCLKECRAEVRSPDMDLKATALLKLVYLEMVGHDMSWASFHVLEVMSSQKLHQKRIGYLAAVQSFRSDTEVLMMATNLLKKDLSATAPTIIQLPISTLPHIITPSLAMSVLPDLLPRLTHSHRVIRKKTIVTLYRMALVYPETLRAAWPKIKERLMDQSEDPSVTAAIVNVVCELGWRRPHDFLPLAPRLFELLVDGGNNWMAIKLIKLFATLTPLEPRLVRKLLPPLTDIIRTTPAMSLLYECINGIIQGGILGSDDDTAGREEIASLCVTKLRSMILANDDPNLKYVALLAFNKIVTTHSYLVSEQEDVILECIDSSDITIRVKALDLVRGMVSSDNLVSIVGRLMRQLKQASAAEPQKPVEVRQIEFLAESDDDAAGSGNRSKSQETPLPEDYRTDVIHRILAMCSQNNYANLTDFDWYIDILTQLLRTAPSPRLAEADMDADVSTASGVVSVSEKVGHELRNVAVKVHVMRPAAVRAADSAILQLSTDAAAAGPGQVTSTALKPMAWMVGEYALFLPSPHDTLSCLLQLIPRVRFADVLSTCLQSAVKLFARIAGGDQQGVLWTAERKSTVSLLLARMIYVFEPLVQHPSLEVQERAVEFTELLKLAAEAVSAQPASTDEVQQDPPLLLTEAIPSLFRGWELNSVAVSAQANVPLPNGLDLDEPINPNLGALLAEADAAQLPAGGAEDAEFEAYYRQRPAPTHVSSSEPAIHRLRDGPDMLESLSSSYQQSKQPTGEEAYLDADILARRKAEREERYRDDPFYIQPPSSVGGSGSGAGSAQLSSTPIHDILRNANGQDLDIDSIPVMQLDLHGSGGDARAAPPRPQQPSAAAAALSRVAARPKIVVAADETLGGSGGSGRSTPRAYESENSNDSGGRKPKLQQRSRKANHHALLQVDSSHLGSLLSLDSDASDSGAAGRGGQRAAGPRSAYDLERQQRADAEMAKALKEVEKRRLEMQRANERVQMAKGVSVEGAVVVTKKKTKKKKATADATAPEGETSKTTTKRKTKKAAAGGGGGQDAAEGQGGVAGGDPAAATDVAPKPRKKKTTAATAAADGELGTEAAAPAVVTRPKKKKARKVDLQGPDLE